MKRNNENEKVEIARISAKQAVIIALITAIATVVVTFITCRAAHIKKPTLNEKLPVYSNKEEPFEYIKEKEKEIYEIWLSGGSLSDTAIQINKLLKDRLEKDKTIRIIVIDPKSQALHYYSEMHKNRTKEYDRSKIHNTLKTLSDIYKDYYKAKPDIGKFFAVKTIDFYSTRKNYFNKSS